MVGVAEGAGSRFVVRSSSALSTLAVRKALAQFGAIERCRLQPGEIVVEFKEEVSPEQIVKVTSINGTEVKVSAPPPTVYMGTIFSQEFQSWSQEELQEELGNQATVIRRLATRNRQSSDSGSILLAFPTSLPDSITVDVLQLKLDVRRLFHPRYVAVNASVTVTTRTPAERTNAAPDAVRRGTPPIPVTPLRAARCAMVHTK